MMRVSAMSRGKWTCTIVVALLVVLSATVGGAQRTVKVKEGTYVIVTLKASISSETCQQDQFLDLEVAQDVKVDGVTVIKAGASARGQVETCAKAGIAGTAGKLRLTILSAKAVDDQNIPLRVTASREGESKTMQAVGGALFCAPLILQKGEPASYSAGNEFPTFTAGDKDVQVL